MSKFDIRPEFECQNRILNVKIRYSVQVRMSIEDFECQKSIFGQNSNVKIRYSVQVRLSKCDFECQNSIFGPNSYVKIGF